MKNYFVHFLRGVFNELIILHVYGNDALCKSSFCILDLSTMRMTFVLNCANLIFIVV